MSIFANLNLPDMLPYHFPTLYLWAPLLRGRTARQNALVQIQPNSPTNPMYTITVLTGPSL